MVSATDIYAIPMNLLQQCAYLC